MKFWLGTHEPSWVTQTDVPLFLSRRRLAGRKTLPRALGPVAIDSGGFSELSLYGRWETPARQYVEEARRFSTEMGNVEWLAVQDWMVEPHLLGKTGLTVREHQRRTVTSYLDLVAAAPDLPWVPVLQGWSVDDYRHHVDAYGRAGVDLQLPPAVGIGSVCRRQSTAAIVPIVQALSGAGLHRLHGFGVKTRGLAQVAPLLASADSMAWSFTARRERIRMDGHAHQNCANCLPYAASWRAQLLRGLS